LSSETKIEDSGAYMQIVHILKRRKPVKEYLERLKASRITSPPTRSKRTVVTNIVKCEFNKEMVKTIKKKSLPVKRVKEKVKTF
jgi:hypothetical protein